MDRGMGRIEVAEEDDVEDEGFRGGWEWRVWYVGWGLPPPRRRGVSRDPSSESIVLMGGLVDVGTGWFVRGQCDVEFTGDGNEDRCRISKLINPCLGSL